MGLETEFQADLQRFDFEVKFLLRRRRPNNQIWEIVTWFWQIHVTTLCLNSLWDDSLTIKYMTDWDVIDWAARLHHFILRHPSIKDKEYFLCWNNHSKQFIFSNIYLMFLFLQLHYVRQSPLLRIYWGSIGPWCSLPKSISVFVPLQESLLDKDGIMLNNLFACLLLNTYTPDSGGYDVKYFVYSRNVSFLSGADISEINWAWPGDAPDIGGRHLHCIGPPERGIYITMHY